MRYLVLLFLCFTGISSQAFEFKLPFNNDTEFLPVTQAFSFSFTPKDDNTVELTWDIAEGYYLYQHQFSVTQTNSSNTGNTNIHFAPFAKGIEKTDPYFGDVIVYRDQFNATVVYDAVSPGTEIAFNITYQGCADRGLCYPPQTLPLKVVSTAATPALSSTDRLFDSKNSNSTNSNSADVAPQNLPAPSQADAVITLLEQGNVFVVMLTLLGLGLLLSLTPCVLPMIPIVSAIVVGNNKVGSTTQAEGKNLSWQGFYYSALYVLGMALTYAAMGALAGYFGTQFNLQAHLQSPVVLIFSMLIFVLLALAMFGVYELRLPSFIQTRLANVGEKQGRSKSLSVIIMGVFATLVVSPCVSAPLAGVIFFISAQGDALYGASMLFVLALGMGAPLLLVGLFGTKVLPKSGEWLNDIKVIMGFGLLAVTLWLAERWSQSSDIFYLWGVFFIFIGVYFWLRHQQQAPANITPIRLGLAIIALIFGTLQIVGAASGNTNMFRPLEKLAASHTTNTTEHNLTFATVYSLEDLNNVIQANLSNPSGSKPILFDLYADWCISCKIMEKEIFMAADVLPLLEQFTLVKADVTKNSAANQALMNHYQLYGPPTVLFFSEHGQHMEELTLIGEPSKKEVTERLMYILASAQ
ncbi:protein-disulfide reductase DsbD [Marinomonas agarivorans]|nr:protein-disulfide reductase DsbD [Marinomonas agarivorans]